MNNYEKYFGDLEKSIISLERFEQCDMCYYNALDCIRNTDMTCQYGFSEWLKQEVEE